jgi:hypothetical protein
MAIHNPALSFFGIVVALVFPGLPLFFHTLFHFTSEFAFFHDRLVVTSYGFLRIIRVPFRQEIRYDEVQYVYFLDKEDRVLRKLRDTVGRSTIPGSEMDYRKENLSQKYGIPKSTWDNFVEHCRTDLDDDATAGVYVQLDCLFSKYKIPRVVRKEAKKTLENDTCFNLTSLRKSLGGYTIAETDWQMLAAEFESVHSPIIEPFLVTKLNVKTLIQRERGKGGTGFAARIDGTLVLSNHDGTKKAYLLHFQDLSRQGKEKFARLIQNRIPHGQFLIIRRGCWAPHRLVTDKVEPSASAA